MPIQQDASNGATTNTTIEQVFGLPSTAPPTTAAPATLGSAPVVSSTPSPGQGVALDFGGHLTAIAQFLGVLASDPASPRTGQFWYRSDTSQLCIQHNSSTTKRVTLT